MLGRGYCLLPVAGDAGEEMTQRFRARSANGTAGLEAETVSSALPE